MHRLSTEKGLQRISILYDASQAVLSTFDLDEVLHQILTIVRDYFHLEGGSILLLDKERKVLQARLTFGKQPPGIEIPLGEGLTGLAAKSKRPIQSHDVSKDSRYIRVVESTKSEVAIPLMVRDEVVGVLDCQSDEIDFFDTETVDLLTLFATQASIALVNAEIYSKEQKRASQLAAINEIARQATAVLKLEELLVRICRSVEHSLPEYGVAVLTVEQDGTLMHRSHGGSKKPLFETSQALLPRGNAGEEVLQQHKTRTLRNNNGQPLMFEGAASELILPLVASGQPLGVLIFAADKSSAFSPEDITAFQSLADICATAIQNAYFFQQVEQLAHIDGLTGIFNRRYFEKRILEEIERASRYDLSLSVIMIDLDHFKTVNDEFGHLLGDEVLRRVSQLFQQTVRKSDVCCRYGGEEFAIILPETSGSNALIAAEKLRNLVAKYEFPGVPRPISLSAGVANFPRNGTTRDDLVRAADENLYLAKQSGRNCIFTPDKTKHINVGS